MSDRNPPTKGRFLASGVVRGDVFDRTFQRISDDLKDIGLISNANTLQLLKGKRIRIEIFEVRN